MTNGEKKKYKSKILSEMKLKKADGKFFWKLLDKLDTPRNNDIFKNNIHIENGIITSRVFSVMVIVTTQNSPQIVHKRVLWMAKYQ